MKLDFAKNSFFYFITDCGVLLISLLTTVVIARVLGPSGKGALSLIFLIPVLTLHFVNLGISQANIYFLGKEKQKRNIIISNSILFSLFIGITTGLIFWFTRDKICQWFSLEEYSRTVGVAAFLFPIFLFSDIYPNLLLGLKLFKERNIAKIFDSMFYLFGILFFVHFYKSGVIGGVISRILASVLLILLVVYYFFRRGYLHRLAVNFSLLRQCITYGIKAQFGNVLQVFTYRLDMFVVNYFLGLTGVGIYSIAVAIAQLLWYLPTAVGKVLFPEIAHNANAGKESDVFIASVSRKMFLITTLGGIALLLTGGFFIPFLFGAKFIPSVRPLFILLPGVVAIGIHKVLIFALMGKGYPHYMSISGIVSVAVTILLDILLIPKYGVSGAALASTLAYTVCAFFTALWFIKVSGLRFADILVPRKSDLEYILDKFKTLR